MLLHLIPSDAVEIFSSGFTKGKGSRSNDIFLCQFYINFFTLNILVACSEPEWPCCRMMPVQKFWVRGRGAGDRMRTIPPIYMVRSRRN
jgi:hypothetical protein